MQEFRIGEGNLIVTGIGLKGIKQEGIGIYAAPEHGHKIDTSVSMEEVSSKELLCAIWFTDLTAARMFQDQVNTACLRMNGYEVKNGEPEKP